MQPTRRTWQHVGLGGVLAGVGLLAAQPASLVGVAGVGAWLLSTQYRTTHTFAQTVDDLTVEVDPLRHSAVVDERLRVTVSAELDDPSPCGVTLTVRLPLTADGPAEADRTIDLAPGETTAATSFTCSFPVAGQFSVPDVEVELTDDGATFTESVTVPVDQTITVDPRHPRNVHVGQGGNRVAAAYGEHAAGSGGSGLVPEEIRQYTAGDSLDNIDWKATARQGSPHVRDYESQTDRKTVLVVDQRSDMAVGPEGESMLDFAREVAIGYARSAEELDDPLGLYLVGDDGIAAKQRPTTSTRGYRRIRDALYEASPTAGPAAPDTTTHLTRPADARRVSRELASENSAFATTLAPFFAETESYVHRIEGDPLFETLRRVQAEVSGTVWTVVLTSDARRNQLRDAIRLATKGGDHASVFLTPRVLYEDGEFADLEAAYDRYADFESFRVSLDRAPRTNVYEVGPGDRLEALLATRRRRS